MIRRRALIRTVGGGVTAGLVSGITGCTGSDDSPAETPTDEYPEGVDPEQARSHYDDAIAELAENAETLDDWAEGVLAGTSRPSTASELTW